MTTSSLRQQLPGPDRLTLTERERLDGYSATPSNTT